MILLNSTRLAPLHSFFLRKTLGSTQGICLFQLIGTLLILVRLPCRLYLFDGAHDGC